MKQDATLAAAATAPTRYWNVDGLPEMEAGALMFLCGIALVAHEVWPSSLTAGFSSAWLPMILAGLFLLLGGRVLRAVRERVTYPRVGYAKPYSPRGGHLAAVVIAGALGLTAAWMAMPRDGSGEHRYLPLMTATVYAVGSVALSLRTHLPRLYGCAAAAVVTGLLSPTYASPDLGVGVVSAACGAALVGGGAFAFLRLRRRPVPEAEQ